MNTWSVPRKWSTWKPLQRSASSTPTSHLVVFIGTSFNSCFFYTTVRTTERDDDVLRALQRWTITLRRSMCSVHLRCHTDSIPNLILPTSRYDIVRQRLRCSLHRSDFRPSRLYGADLDVSSQRQARPEVDPAQSWERMLKPERHGVTQLCFQRRVLHARSTSMGQLALRF